MKNLIKSFLFTMTFLLIICKPGVASTFATPNIELQGNANGIVFIQGDEPFLFYRKTVWRYSDVIRKSVHRP